MIFRSRPKSFNLIPVIEGCIKQQPSAQRALVEQFYGLAKRICLRYAANPFESEEMVDDGFLKIFEKIGEFDHSKPFEPWLSRIMVNTAIDYFRKHHSRVVLTDIEEAFDISVASTQLEELSADELLSLVQELPPAYRMVFNLCAIEGYDHKEAAEMMGISESTSRSNLFKARAKLQQWVLQLTNQRNQPATHHVFRKF